MAIDPEAARAQFEAAADRLVAQHSLDPQAARDIPTLAAALGLLDVGRDYVIDLLGGLRGDGYSWSNLAEALGAETRRVRGVVFDVYGEFWASCRGCGCSMVEDYEGRTFAEHEPGCPLAGIAY